jgi:hypothetical protein
MRWVPLVHLDIVSGWYTFDICLHDIDSDDSCSCLKEARDTCSTDTC